MDAQQTVAAPWLAPYHFQPGQSGNPAGKPKGALSLTKTLNNLLAVTKQCKDPLSELHGEYPHAYLVAAALINAAEAGDVQAAKTIFERIEGKAAQQSEADLPINEDRMAIATRAAERILDVTPKGVNDASKQTPKGRKTKKV